MEKWRDGDEPLCRCVTKRGDVKSKWQMSERRRDTATVHTETAQAKCIKGDKTQKNTANMHRQWKLTVNSQNRVAMTKPQYRTQTSYIFNSQSAATLSSGEELNISLLLQHTETRTVDSDVTVTVQTPTRTDRNKAYSTHGR